MASISPEEINELRGMKTDVEMAKLRAENAFLSSELKRLNFNNFILKIARKYGLGDGQFISMDGEILEKEAGSTGEPNV